MSKTPASDKPTRSLPQLLFEIGKLIGSVDDLGALLGRISELVTEMVGANACSIMLLDVERGILLGKAAYGPTRESIGRVAFKLGQGVAGWVAEQGEPTVIDDVRDDPRFVNLAHSAQRIRSLVCVPLIAREARIGVLTATSPEIAAFDDSTVEILGFVGRTMALDVENFRLRRRTVTDPLTGAYNREYLQGTLEDLLERARLAGEPISVAMIDIDHFKQVNDKHGHDVGDDVLAEVANRLRGAIRGNDSLIRYGGEEFLVLLPKSDRPAARRVAERMRNRLAADAVVVSGKHIEIRVSIGVAEAREGDDPRALIRRADEALYRAKGAGRDRVEVAD